ncbi:MAG TPA: DUF1385 domain-containing protein, partial [Bryobacteraceae bacterium]|nr:DUF1385 domain-containing protein [Bryobacteraceae bacterium]
ERIPLNIRNFLRLSAHVQMLPILESGEETLVGGQAVMEGVMMRAPHSYCVAIRKPDGQIAKEEMPVPRMSEKYPIFKLPVLRGLGTLGQAMGLGFKALSFSAKAALAEETAAGENQGPAAESKGKEMPGWVMGANLAFSLLFFLFLYKFVPLFLATQIGHRYPALNGRVTINLIDGTIRILILLTFLYLISRMKDMHRVFEYHGAEHKVVFNYESGKPVTVENAQQFVTWHPRCGTSFLLVVMVISLLVYAFLPFDGFWAKFATRIAGLPLVVGVSYELIRAAAKSKGMFLKALTAPGLWLQRVTTQPPNDEQAAVAISALEGAMALEESQGGQLVIA